MILKQEEVEVIKKLISIENLETFKRLLYLDIDIDNNASKSDITQALTELCGGVLPANLNTIKKIITAIDNDPNFSINIKALLDKKINIGDVYTKEEIDGFNMNIEYINNEQIDGLFMKKL